jgi:hypothetical protein
MVVTCGLWVWVRLGMGMGQLIHTCGLPMPIPSSYRYGYGSLLCDPPTCCSYIHVVKEWLVGCYFDSQGKNKQVVGGVEEDNGKDKCILSCTALHNSQLYTLNHTKSKWVANKFARAAGICSAVGNKDGGKEFTF